MKGPSTSTIYHWIQNEKFPHFEEFRNVENTKYIIDFWKNLYEFDNLKCILSIDAMKLDEDLYIDHKGVIDGVVDKNLVHIPENIRGDFIMYSKIFNIQVQRKNIVNSIFIATLCPLCSIKSFPLHIYLSSSSSASNYILNFIETIPDILKENNIDVIGISTDSDPSYRNMFNTFFDEWSKYIVLHKGNIFEIPIHKKLITNDCPHILKRVRSRLITKTRIFANKIDWINFENNMKKKK